MNIPCPASISCPGSDLPLSNFSSEDPDFEAFLGNFPRNYSPPLGSSWNHSWCYGICVSHISQEDADLCAERNSVICSTTDPPDPRGGDGDGGGGGGGGGGPTDPPQDPPPTGLKGNEAQTECVTCPDGGTPFCYTVPAGTFVDRSESVANEAARQLAQRKAQENRLCCPDLTAHQCKGDELGDTIPLVGNNPPFEITATGLPPGMFLEVIGNYEAFVGGTVDQPGNYLASVTITDSKGNSKTCQSMIEVMGLSNCPLPDAVPDVAYSQQLQVEGGTAPYTFAADPNSLPYWMSVSSSGLVTGTPDAAEGDSTADILVTITDSEGHQCQQRCEIYVTAGCPDPGTKCTAYSFQMTPASGTWSISGLPAGLTCSAGGLITGTPSQSGTIPLSITHTDTGGHLRSWSCNMTVAGDGDTCPRSVADIGPWVLVTDLNTLAGTMSGAPVGGDATINFHRPTGGPVGGGMRRIWRANIKHCASHGDYPLTYSIGIAFSRGSDTHMVWSVGYYILGALRFSKSSQTAPSDSGSGSTSPQVVQSGTGCNPTISYDLYLDVQLSTGYQAADDIDLTVTITLRPLAPP